MKPIMLDVLAVASGGAMGALLRYGLSSLIHNYIDKSFAWGTFTANICGAFIIGVLWQFFQGITAPSSVKLLLFVGLLGGFTTFSSYALECVHHFQKDGSKIALIYMLVSNVVGVLMVFTGMMLVKYFPKLG